MSLAHATAYKMPFECLAAALSRGAAACALALAVCTAGSALAADARVAVAANFAAATRRLAPAFERESGHRVTAAFASTGTLYAQIRNGAPFDAFLAADALRPALLEREGLAVAGSRFTFAVGRLALWAPGLSAKSDGGAAGAAMLRRGGFRALAIANPKTAPYGAAAREVLERLGQWETLRGRIVLGQNIAQTYQFVASGNAELGFVALAQLRAEQPAARSWLPPPEWHAPLAQQAVLLRRGAANAAARGWLDYLRGPAARAIMESLGYGT